MHAAAAYQAGAWRLYPARRREMKTNITGLVLRQLYQAGASARLTRHATYSGGLRFHKKGH